MAPLRVALVGCGGIAAAHEAAIRSHPATSLVAAVDVDESARQRASAEWTVPTFAGLREMIRAMDVDAACVCTPPSTHLALALELLEHGVHVMCEKPLAPSVEEAERMVRAAGDRDRVLMVSSKFRHVPEIARAREMIDAGAVGRPLFYEVAFCARIDMSQRWNTRPELSGGGVLMDNGCHAIDVLDQLLDGSITRIAAALAQPPGSNGVEDTVEVLLQTDTGRLARIALSWSYFTRDLDYAAVQGTEGTLRLGWTGGATRRHGEREWTPFGQAYNKTGAFTSLLDSFVAAVRNGGARNGPHEAVTAVSLIECAYAAARAGAWSEVATVDA